MMQESNDTGDQVTLQNSIDRRHYFGDKCVGNQKSFIHQSHYPFTKRDLQPRPRPRRINRVGSDRSCRQIKYGSVVARVMEVCELGARSGLPGLNAFTRGARVVALTDYPDESILACLWDNLWRNISEQNVFTEEHKVSEPWCTVEGYEWGQDAEPLKR
jgi:hypothetical protein